MAASLRPCSATQHLAASGPCFGSHETLNITVPLSTSPFCDGFRAAAPGQLGVVGDLSQGHTAGVYIRQLESALEAKSHKLDAQVRKVLMLNDQIRALESNIVESANQRYKRAFPPVVHQPSQKVYNTAQGA